ncbi:MAG: tartrate dehydrogenase [Actinobacteria bacterium]|nr:tartrate dehydrogenase [Actinomycetota bacterium]
MASIAVIAGDGVGKEVIPAGLRVLGAVASFDVEIFPWGADHYAETGAMMPGDALRRLAEHDAIYLGAVGWPTVPDHISLWGLLLPIRKAFQLYANIRPVKLPPGVAGPLANRGPDDIDMMFVRENTEGEYAGAGGRVHVGTPYEVAVEAPVFTRLAVERVARYAFDLARQRSGSLVSVTKSNASRYAYVLWDEVVNEVAEGYRDVTVQRMHVDAMAARMVLRPDSIDVVVASNLFADILTDLGAALQGSLGLAASANLDPTRSHPSLFEPVHGSAPDIAGQGRANPIGAIWTGALMLRHLGLAAEADRVEAAVFQVLADGVVRTGDLGGSASTDDVADAVISALRAAARARTDETGDTE